MKTPMRVIHKRDIIRQVRERWDKQYAGRDDFVFYDGRTVGCVRQKLAALDLETCSSSDVAAAIAPSWFDNLCDECDEDVPMLIRIGAAPDVDARWRDVCPQCLAKAAAILAETEPKQ